MRKKEIVAVPKLGGGRDDGKTFMIDEMSAAQAEKWALRMFIALKGTSAAVPDDVARFGMVGVAIRGLNAFLAADVRFVDIEPLLDDMLTCVRIVRDPHHPDVATALMSDDIEEVQTRVWLRGEVLRVHTGFSVAEAFSLLVSAIKTGPQDSPIT